MIEIAKLSDAEVERLTLEWVNGVRAKHGMKALKQLRPGRTKHQNYCVIARSLKNGAINYTYTDRHSTMMYKAKGGTISESHPPIQVEFIRRFDTGAFPHLVYKRG